ncbi:hypothetical protein PN466_08975 [Roseofilum reptotaenium CS-1145]|nr:hypothetical protein [Roseofilum reptotaenium]MDB9517079.1 hypothetical protein [Roseofilum reptotaenium CS-1145]
MGYTSKSPKTGENQVGGTVWQRVPVSSSVYGKWTDMDYIDLAIAVLKSQDPYLIHSLTDFLMVLPTPGQIEGVLQDAVNQLAQIDRNTHQWILEHSGYLMPYIDLLQEKSGQSSVCPSDWINSNLNTAEFLA